MQRSLTSRSLFDFPTLRMPMFFDDNDDLLNFSNNDLALASGGLSVSEDENNVYVEASVPGINPDDVEVTMDKGILWIRGKAREEENDKKKKYYRQSQREFSYRVAVPGEIDPNAEPDATYERGQVKLTLPKVPQTQPKKIAIKTNHEMKQQKNKE